MPWVGLSEPAGRAESLASRGVPWTRPKPQLSAFISTEISALAGTLTATGLKPKPQQLPGKRVYTSTSPLWRSRMVNSGLVPSGMKFEYSSPNAP